MINCISVTGLTKQTNATKGLETTINHQWYPINIDSNATVSRFHWLDQVPPLLKGIYKQIYGTNINFSFNLIR